jgi:hypothetical protein
VDVTIHSVLTAQWNNCLNRLASYGPCFSIGGSLQNDCLYLCTRQKYYLHRAGGRLHIRPIKYYDHARPHAHPPADTQIHTITDIYQMQMLLRMLTLISGRNLSVDKMSTKVLIK